MPYWDHKAKPANSAGFLLCAPSRAYISPCTPRGLRGVTPQGDGGKDSPARLRRPPSVGLRSAFGLRIPFGSEIGPLVNETGFEFGLVQKRAVM